MKTKGFIEGDDLDKLILALSGGGDPAENERLRQKLRARNPRFAEVARRSEEGDREVFGIPDAATLRSWLCDLGRPEIEVAEGKEEPLVIQPQRSLKNVKGKNMVDYGIENSINDVKSNINIEEYL